MDIPISTISPTSEQHVPNRDISARRKGNHQGSDRRIFQELKSNSGPYKNYLARQRIAEGRAAFRRMTYNYKLFIRERNQDA